MEKTLIKVAEPKKIGTSKLAELLKAITKSTICSITYVVDDSRSKTIQGQKQVQKEVNISNVYLNHDYTQKVRNLTGVENFVAQELKGKTRVCGTLLLSDKTNELMLDGKVLNSESAKVLAYYHKGVEITEAEAISKELWTPAYYQPKEVNTMGRGRVAEEDNFNIINTYLSRIVKIKLEGTMYEIV